MAAPTAIKSGLSRASALPCAGNDGAYRAWRERKLARYPRTPGDLVCAVSSLENPPDHEIRAIAACLARANMALYQCDPDYPVNAPALMRFAARFGLRRCEHHRSAHGDTMVALEVADDATRARYIPYSNRPLNWHTDGYYNAIETPVRAFLLHCVRSAPAGGANALLDPEIAYIRLRDENPAFIPALMHPRAMTIPENRHAEGTVRPARTGPVFSIDAKTNALHMRYSARSGNIVWRDDEETRAAVRFLRALLDGGEPLIHAVTLRPGQGILCANVLHKRTGFEDRPERASGRLLYRIRFLDSLARRDDRQDTWRN